MFGFIKRRGYDGSFSNRIHDFPKGSALDFPHCDPVRMTWSQLSRYDGRIECWDAEPRGGYRARSGPHAALTHCDRTAE